MATEDNSSAAKLGLEFTAQQLLKLVTALPNFVDDPELANAGLLDDIIREWYEEISST